MRILLPILYLAVLMLAPISLKAENRAPYSGMREVSSGMPFSKFEARIIEAIGKHKMGLVAQACADCGAKQVLGLDIPKNRILMIFHPRFAVRMLKASIAAGIEAPLRLYLTEAKDGSATLTYRLPSHVFGAYGVADLDAMGKELDEVVAAIVASALK